MSNGDGGVPPEDTGVVIVEERYEQASKTMRSGFDRLQRCCKHGTIAASRIRCDRCSTSLSTLVALRHCTATEIGAGTVSYGLPETSLLPRHWRHRRPDISAD